MQRIRRLQAGPAIKTIAYREYPQLVQADVEITLWYSLIFCSFKFWVTFQVLMAVNINVSWDVEIGRRYRASYWRHILP